MKKIISFSQVNKKFKKTVALDNVSFEVSEGEIFGFLGPSGAGKTTTINILTSQLDVDSGNVEILEKNSQNLTYNDFVQIGIMSDNVGFYDRLTLYDNLKFFAKFHNVSIDYLDNLLKRLDLYDDRFKRANQLSTGMKQRMLLIRAILHTPKIVFLDEPTSGMDPTLSKKVHDILLELKNKGISIFLTTHNMDEATKLCDNVALLYKGKIIEMGSPQSVIDKYSQNDKVKIVFFDGSEKIVLKEEASKYLGINTKTINSLENNLENIFIQLTGDKLND